MPKDATNQHEARLDKHKEKRPKLQNSMVHGHIEIQKSFSKNKEFRKVDQAFNL